MRLIRIALVALTLGLIAGCEKEVSLELGQENIITKADSLKTLVSGKTFRLVRFYSDIPIDYVETDAEIKSETNLWSYVSGYLKDDNNTITLGDNTVVIEQNAVKMPGLPDEVLSRPYRIGTDEDGLFMEFLDYQYNPLIYRIWEIGDDYFILYIPWTHGASLYSRFELLP